METAVIIPARLHSTRLPRKVLLELCGKPMIRHVYEAAARARTVSHVYIATDSEEVAKACRPFTSDIILTSPEHESGTDRLAEAAADLSVDAVINVQGDEPLMQPELIDAIAQQLRDRAAPMISAMHRIDTVTELQSPDVVKVVVDHRQRALYFSRSIIPHHRDNWRALLDHHTTISKPLTFYRHIGIYGYTRSFLLRFAAMEPTYLERTEKLEQLRVLEHGESIQMVETSYRPMGVDTQEDLDRVRRLIPCP